MSAAPAPTTVTRGRRRVYPSLIVALAAALIVLGPLGGEPALATDPPASEPPAARPDKPPRADPRPGGDRLQLTPAEQRVENVIAASRQYLGIPYRVGSEGPMLFDCSGLVFRAFSDAGLVDRISGGRLRAAGYMRWFARQAIWSSTTAASTSASTSGTDARSAPCCRVSPSTACTA
jgi:cell wall-associated NlpC family hydrolase